MSNDVWPEPTSLVARIDRAFKRVVGDLFNSSRIINPSLNDVTMMVHEKLFSEMMTDASTVVHIDHQDGNWTFKGLKIKPVNLIGEREIVAAYKIERTIEL